MFSFAIIGYGQRGRFYAHTLQKKQEAKVVAVFDVNQEKLQLAKNECALTEECCFLTEEEFFAKGKIADVLVIASTDDAHYRQAKRALEMGYHLVLEKPIAQREEECVELENLAKKLERKVFVCHVLRYAPIFTEIKRMLDSGTFGDVITISETEHVGWWHQAHSYVRGNWRNSDTSSPMILAKCCHDLDILVWLIGKKCQKVSSFGGLNYFIRSNAPEGSSNYCYNCKYKDTCLYNAMKFYQRYPDFAFASGQYFGDPNDKESIAKCFSDETNPYSRCVFKCDNNVVDNQVVNLQFEHGVTAQMTMTAFCEGGIRTIRLHCTKGEIEASMLDNVIKYIYFDPNEQKFQEKKVEIGKTFSGHGGGDELLIDDVLKDLRGKPDKQGLTLIEHSVLSHKIAFAAEKSRTNGGNLVDI